MRSKFDIYVLLKSCYFFVGLSGGDFRFLSNGDGPARYRILNFYQARKGIYEWNTVGFFKDGNLTEVCGCFFHFMLIYVSSHQVDNIYIH